ncbi:hypothetical protein AC579_6779 [Pseudocercospora musae]|uniref:Major facilitator superfamily (MFS) profile domain-containing protein n=1 Tax=Pseudocercospora musae TaxID=113226 RepID=A0A139I3H7_9PEZI|nr:hypothetical protein AC579_6779 [Pseudocercospora musae]
MARRSGSGWLIAVVAYEILDLSQDLTSPFAIYLDTPRDLQSSVLFSTSHLVVQHTMRPSHRRAISSQCAIETQCITEKDDLPSPPHSTDRPLSVSRLLILTCGAGALQMFWSTVMANLPPFLHDLGISKSFVSIILVSGPLSGCIVAPIAGLVSDRLRSRWGRRRPFILAGAFITAIALLMLAWQRVLIRTIACPGGSCGDNELPIRHLIQAGAIWWTIVMTVSVQPLQAGIRSLMIEQAPAHEQNRVSAWASRVAGLTGIVSLYASSVNLPTLLHLEQIATQFQILAFLNSTVLGTTSVFICICIEEPDTRLSVLPATNTDSAISVLLLQFRESLRSLSERIKSICKVQFCAWFAWFSLLYGTTTYIQELQKPQRARASVNPGDGAQAGSFASLCFAVIGLVASFVLPMILSWRLRLQRKALSNSHDIVEEESRLLHRCLTWSLGWIAVLLLAAPMMDSQLAGTILVALCGVSWAINQWVPFAIIGQDVKIDRSAAEQAKDQTESLSKAGTTVGVYGIAVSLPQILAGLTNSVVYSMAETMGSSAPTSWILTLGGCAALGAVGLAKRLL